MKGTSGNSRNGIFSAANLPSAGALELPRSPESANTRVVSAPARFSPIAAPTHETDGPPKRVPRLLITLKTLSPRCSDPFVGPIGGAPTGAASTPVSAMWPEGMGRMARREARPRKQISLSSSPRLLNSPCITAAYLAADRSA